MRLFWWVCTLSTWNEWRSAQSKLRPFLGHLHQDLILKGKHDDGERCTWIMPENGRWPDKTSENSSNVPLKWHSSKISKMYRRKSNSDNTIFCCKIALTYKNIFPYISAIQKQVLINFTYRSIPKIRASFEVYRWNDHASVAGALYKIWKPLRITFIGLKISDILGMHH